MTDYSKMSDFEINKQVAEIAIGGDWFLEPTDESPSWFVNHGVEGKNTVKLPDYCNNPADAWPIIIAKRIGVIPAPSDGLWRAAHRDVGADGTPHYFNQCKNPLRAAMIVFLMMKETEQCSS
ncbi:TPA: DUF2591 domain-containing protein [Serratia liquefaciens]|nr:DUF2591 domain-containing protein [Serratia liquefaciens]